MRQKLAILKKSTEADATFKQHNPHCTPLKQGALLYRKKRYVSTLHKDRLIKPRKSHQHQSWREQQTTYLPCPALMDLPLAAHSQREFAVFNHFHGWLPGTLHCAIQAMDGTLTEIRDGSVSFSGERMPEEGTMDYNANAILLTSEP